MSDTLRIGLDHWVIMDGNYRDFVAGSDVAFALNAYTRDEPLRPISASDDPAPQLRRVGDGWYDTYDVVARVTYVGERWIAIDAGIGAYIDTWLRPELEPLRATSWVAGRIELGVDCFSYFETYAQEPDAPPLIYDWRIDRIEMPVGPKIEIDGRLQYDRAQAKWAAIAETNAAGDGAFWYRLHCARLGPPRMTIAPAPMGARPR